MKQGELKRLASMAVQLEQMSAELEQIKDDEQEAHDAKSEKWQESEAGEASAERLSNIELAIEQIEAAKDSLSDAQGGM